MPEYGRPFAKLPSRSPAIFGTPDAQQQHPFLVDDLNHPLDIGTLTSAAICAALDVEEDSSRVGSLRTWIAKHFFAYHSKMYTKSHRRAPIWLQLSTPSLRYSVWLNMHASTEDTLFRLQTEVLVPKLAQEQRLLDSLRVALQEAPTSANTKAIERQEQLVADLRGFADEVRLIAPIWKPCLDDGMNVTGSMLWRLFGHNKAWQAECRTTWDALCRGDHDWSRLAMHLWPERVVPKCAIDRSLAITHDIEHLLWAEDSETNKWQQAEDSQKSVLRLMAQRSSPALKSCLDELTRKAAPAPRTRARRVRVAG